MADDDKKKTDEAQKEAEEAVEKAEEKADEAEEAAEEAQEAAEKAEEAVEEVKEIVAEVKEEKVQEKKEEPKSAVKVSKKLEELITQIEKLSVLELSELVKALQDKFGVSAVPAMVAQAPANGAAAQTTEGPAEGQTTFNVILSNSGANKIGVIKALREINQQLGLKEAKDIADAPPKEILTAVNKETAEEAKQKLTAAGAQVELK